MVQKKEPRLLISAVEMYARVQGGKRCPFWRDKDTPELRTPLKKDTFLSPSTTLAYIATPEIRTPLYKLLPVGVRIRGVLL